LEWIKRGARNEEKKKPRQGVLIRQENTEEEKKLDSKAGLGKITKEGGPIFHAKRELEDGV